jgi:hypothetical protein
MIGFWEMKKIEFSDHLVLFIIIWYLNRLIIDKLLLFYKIIIENYDKFIIFYFNYLFYYNNH